MSDLETLISAKNAVMSALQKAKALPDAAKITTLARKAASLEKKIADMLHADGRTDEALINMISQASCHTDAGELSEAIAVLVEARSLTRNKKLIAWIDGLVAKHA